jgi:hypothetical protein
MTQSPDREPVSEEEYAQMPEKIEAAFDEIRELLAADLGGEPEDYETDPDQQ